MYPTILRRRTDGLQNLQRLSSALDNAFNDTFASWPLGSRLDNALTAAWVPACDVSEDKDSIRITVEVPGVNPDDVQLQMENNILTIRGEKRQEVDETSDRVHRYERSYGSFERTFALPSTVDADKIEADISDGVLTVTLPKAEKARPRQIDVKSRVGMNNGDRVAVGSGEVANGK